MSETRLRGIHHVTAIAGDPQANVDFYTRVLGMRLDKKTVNFDDPGTYHLYYGDDGGSPGTILTFFPWPGARRGRRGPGQVVTTAFAVPAGAIGYWSDRLRRLGVAAEEPAARFGAPALTLLDPDGLELELIEQPGVEERPAWSSSPVPEERAVRGFHGVTLAERRLEPTAALLGESFGWPVVGEEKGRTRFATGGGGPGTMVDLVARPGEELGVVAAGSVHHVAWRAADDGEHLGWRERVAAAGLRVTPVVDRSYFRSIYFREPGGVLFEIATDDPGFTIDEAPAELGSALRLPPWLEADRARIEAALPPLEPAPDRGERGAA